MFRQRRSSGDIVCINIKRVCGFVVSHISYALFTPHRSTTYAYMRPIVIDRVGWSVGLSVTLVSPAKTAEAIELPFGLRAQVGPRNHVLHGVQIPIGRGNFEGETGKV